MKQTIMALAAVSVLAAAGLAFAGDDAKGGLRYSISVTKFENKAGWSGQWDLGDAWGSIMTDALNSTKKFIVLGEKDMRIEAMQEQNLGESGRTAGGKKTPKVGNLTPAQLLVKGEITHVQSSTAGGEGGFSFKGIRLGGSKDTAEINATVYIIDSETAQVKASTKVVGKAGRKGLSVGYSGSALGGLGGDFDGFKKDNVGKATEDAVAQAVEFLVKQLDKIPWEGTVVSSKSGKVIINRGSREGVSEGQSFVVGKTDVTRDPDTGEVLDTSVEKVAKIKAKTVKEKISICEATEGADKIEAKMSVMPE
ncbi:MAG: CsgG/HfaB family protein [bacterium]|jgi:curli biogenesis system outer membrane secretion channel CsgG